MTNPRVWILGLPFGGPFNGRDRHRTYFDARTDFWLKPTSNYKVIRVHGLREAGRVRVLGETQGHVQNPKGIWFDAVLENTPSNWAIRQEVDQGLWYASSGAMEHLTRHERDGRAVQWPLGEISLVHYTEGPSNPYAVVSSVIRSLPYYRGEINMNWTWDESRQEYRYWSQQLGRWVYATEYDALRMAGDPPDQPPPIGAVPPAMPSPPPVVPPVVTPPVPQASSVVPPVFTPPVPASPTVDDLQRQMSVMQQQMAAQRMTPGQSPVGSAPNVNVNHHQRPLWHNGCTMTNAIRSLIDGQYNVVTFLLRPVDGMEYNEQGQAIRASQSTSLIGSLGGAIVPVEYSANLIEELIAKTLVRQAGAVVWPMGSDTLNIPKKNQGTTAQWVGQRQAPEESDLGFGTLQLIAHKLMVLSNLPAELFADSNPQIEGIIMSDMTEVMALTEDLTFLTGSGSEHEPTGLRNIDEINVETMGGNGVAIDFDYLSDMRQALDLRNVGDDGRGWFMSPRTAGELRKLKINGEDNHYAWADPLTSGDPPTIWGYPVYTSTAIAIDETQGEAVNATTIYLGRWPDFAIGQRLAMELRVSDEAGDAFAEDTILVRAKLREDCNVRHTESFELLEGVIPPA